MLILLHKSKSVIKFFLKLYMDNSFVRTYYGSYRDSHIFSDTLDKFFMVNWFTWPWSLLNTKFTLILYPHILKISLRLSNYGSRYSLADNQRSSSEITHPHCLAFMREKIDASSVLSLNNLIKINTWILTWCRNQI